MGKGDKKKQQIEDKPDVGRKGPLEATADGPTPSPMGPWGPSGIQSPRRPNLYQLQGDHLHITFSPSGFDGKPYFTYHDAHQALNFSGNAIRTTNTEFGALVSVTIGLGIGGRSTVFTLVAPAVALIATSHAPLKTFGITTIQEIGIGQTQVYAATELSGAASIVKF